MNNVKKNANKGFSLVELIVVIAIMAVLVAVLAPSLLQYVERSRAQKDDSAMGEVANAIMLALSDQEIYDEVLNCTCKGNASCYVDETHKAAPVDTITNPLATYTTYGDDNRLDDETRFHFAGDMRGMTITFVPVDEKISIAQGVINAAMDTGADRIDDEHSDAKWYNAEDGAGFTGKSLAKLTKGSFAESEPAGAHHYLYNRVRATVGDTISINSQTYRNSNYTVFICMGSTGGNSDAGQDSVQVYGQWDGTNLAFADNNIEVEEP